MTSPSVALGGPPQLSVAICTFNRAASLKHTLHSLAGQAEAGTADWELLVIDNNSRDDTSRVISDFVGRLPVRALFEGVQGLSHARNRALTSYRGSVLLFTDDDVVLEPNWLSRYSRAVKDHPEADYFGGRILPRWRGARPAWLRDEGMALIAGVLGRYDLGDADRSYVSDDSVPFGANFALRRELASRMGSFRTDLGVVGSIPGRAEETAYLERAVKAGAKGYYVGSALVWHAVEAHRLRARHLFRHGVHSGVAVARMNGRPENGSYVRLLLFFARGAFQLAKGRGDRARQCVINAGIQLGLRRAGVAPNSRP